MDQFKTKIDLVETRELDPPEIVKGTLSVGDLVSDRYEVLAHLGSGGMGEVYKVLDRETKTIYALKMISPHLADQKTLAKRLEHEAQAARTLAHGNIVSVYDVGNSNDGAPYLIMDYIEGDSLEQLLKKETLLAANRAVPIFIQIAEALVHAQQKSIVHRDLKPSNILMTKTPNGVDMVKIVDFGIAKISDQDSADKTKLTQTGDLLGTPLYMSPEQCTGDELDARSDIYSFGCIMYEVLSGRPLFAADNPVKIILKHLNEIPPPLPVGAGISADLKQVIARCLEKHRSDRYATAVDLQIDLERVLDGRAIKPYASKKKTQEPKRPRILMLSAILSVLLLPIIFFAFQSKLQHENTNQVDIPIATAPQRPEAYDGKTLAQWTSAIEHSPDDPQLYFSRGELHANRDERTNAIDDFTQAIKLKPDYLEAYKERATIYALIAQPEKAAKDADKLIALAPDSAQGYETRGWVNSTREQYPQAIADWKRAISLNNNGYYYYHLATDSLKLGKYQEAEKAINEGIELRGEHATYRGVAGVIATFKQDYDTAYRQLKLATEAPGGRGVEWQELAYYYTCVGKLDEAEKAMQHAKALETFPARAFRLAGEYYRTAGQFDKAVQEFSASTSLEEYPPGYRERAVTYISLGQWRSAYADLKKSLELNPYSDTTLSYLALVEDHLGMKTAAADHIAKAYKATELPPIVYANRAAIELNSGDTTKALKDAATAVSKDPWLKEGYEIRSRIYKALNNNSAAQADHAKADKLVSHLDL